MASDSSVFGLAVLGVVVGLAVLLFGAEEGDNTIVSAGGVVVLAAVGLMTLRLSRMDAPAEGEGPAGGH
jgi:uncharacterized protein YjlB